MPNPIARREFLAGSLAVTTASLTLGATETAAATPSRDREFYEWRTYSTANADNHNIVSTYVEKALLPALGRMGLDRIGAFVSVAEPDKSLSLLIPHKSLETLAGFNDALAADGEYQDAAAVYFAAPRDDPAFLRIENRLMRAFKGMPVIELPPQTKNGDPRIFELRIYESHNEHMARLKVEMFNEGEIQIMRDVKLAPVFYGETLVSGDVPNLTYMLSGENAEAHKQHFQDFLKHPEWDRMKKLEKYKGTVSKITSVFYSPTEWSQI